MTTGVARPVRCKGTTRRNVVGVDTLLAVGPAARCQTEGTFPMAHVEGTFPMGYVEIPDDERLSNGRTIRRAALTESFVGWALETQIASLAASGLSNKQIGARLYPASRHGVRARLRIFPEPGISTRAALRDALT